MENVCLEELYHVNEEIRKQNGKAFNIQVMLNILMFFLWCLILF